ncbi:HD domain protein [Neisseria meningitidis 2005040]|nr:HD domain protein [Neisseria meningitidis 2005040]
MTAISPIQDTQSATLQELREWFDSYCAALPDNEKPRCRPPYGEPLSDHFLGAAQMVDELDLLPDAVAATLLADIGRYVPDWNLLVSERCNSTVAELVKGVDEVQKLPTSPGWTASPRQKNAPSRQKLCGKCCWRWLPTSASC